MNMNPHPTYSSALSYVLQLRQDAPPGTKYIAGRIENLRSGKRIDFASADELLAVLHADFNQHDPLNPKE